MKNLKFITYLLITLVLVSGCEKESEPEIQETIEPSKVISVLLGSIEGFTGPCAKKFDFEGEIKVDGPITVKYVWLRSDGALATENTITFEEAGTKTVSTSWTLGESGNSYEDYWQQLKIVSPKEMVSNKSEFDLHCDEEALSISATTTVVGSNEFNGECPKKFDFEAAIDVEEPTTISYTWLRSDGATAPEVTLEFEEAGSKTVTTSWTLGENGNSYEDYWQQLKIITPQEILSNKAEFDLHCADETVSISATANVVGEDSFTGECPKKFDFEAEIEADGPVTVKYTWLRSDGGNAPEYTVEFEEAGTKTITTSWTLGGDGNSYEDYWQQLKIIAPQTILSNKAEFDLHCEDETVTITATANVVGENNFTGECPKKFDFEGEIEADGPMTVKYTWLRSDGATSPEHTIEFNEAGTKIVTKSWTLGASGNAYEGYWQQLKIIAPEEILSNKAEFDLHCDVETVSITASANVVGENNYTGECPKKLDFNAEIEADGSVTVKYTWLRSDGATSPEYTIEFNEAGTKTVSTSWTLGGGDNSYEGYWQQLKIISPQEILSNKAFFDLTCEVEISEDCLSFDYNNLLVEKVGDNWRITNGVSSMMIFRSLAKAQLAVNIMKHYKMTSHCFAIRPNPGLEYLTVQNELPSGSYTGEDCISINPNNLTIRKNNATSYSILDGNTIPFSAKSLEEAQKIVALVEKYQPNYTCYVERPNPGMVYLRK